MKYLFRPILVILLSVIQFGAGLADDSIGNSIAILNKSAAEGEIIAEFAEYANDGDVIAAMQLLTPAISGREDIVKRDFINRVFPFFKQYKRIDNARTIGSSRFPDGSQGTTHYVYIITEEDVKKPFMISFRTEQGEPVIVSIEVDKCVSNRHPSCAYEEDDNDDY